MLLMKVFIVSEIPLISIDFQLPFSVVQFPLSLVLAFGLSNRNAEDPATVGFLREESLF